MFPPKKKAPAIGVMIGLGPKGDDSGGGPQMPPKYKSGGGGMDSGGAGDSPMGGPPKPPKPPSAAPSMTPPGMGAAHEAAESPAEESGEEYGARLLSDMTAPLIAAGMPEEHAKTTLAGIFDAMAKCLRGEGAGGNASDSMDMSGGGSGGMGG